MVFEGTLRSLREFDIGDLNADNIGSWPPAVKVIIYLLVLMLVLVLGYYYHVDGLRIKLGQEREQETKLKQEFEKKSFQAANLEAYRRQMEEMEATFGTLVAQLPSDTEVPGLLEDITAKGMLNGLNIASIDLQNEQAREFYIELPISIQATGSYHDLGAFISGMAGLPRIVTLHDFSIKATTANTNQLSMHIVAKTYRYKDGEAGG
ncbi:MAG: type 4a pilus biogenesis protein PilO [Parahaliea sp.]